VYILKPSAVPASLFHFAWRKTRESLFESNGVFDPVEVALFEGALDTHIERMIHDFTTGTYCTAPIHSVAFPKANNEARPMSLISVRDQLAWVTFALAIGELVDTNPMSNKASLNFNWMVDWSFSGRLYRRFVPPDWAQPGEWQKDSWRRGDISMTSKTLYDRVPYAWRRYRNFLRSNAEDLCKEGRKAFHGRTDISKFFPSVRMVDVENVLLDRLKEAFPAFPGIHDDWVPVVRALCTFEVHHPELDDADLDKLYGSSRELGAGVGVLPTGLAVAPFLANLFLTPVDRVLEELRQQHAANGIVTVVGRFMDDVSIISTAEDGVRDVIRTLGRELGNRGLKLSESKTSPLLSVLDNPFGLENTLTTGRLRPFITRTLDQVSAIAQTPVEALRPAALEVFTDRIRDLVEVEMAETEIRSDTKLSFAAWKLRRLAIYHWRSGAPDDQVNGLVQEVINCYRQLPQKISLLRAVLTLLVEIEQYDRLSAFLVQDILGSGADWEQKTGRGFVRGYTLLTLATILNPPGREWRPILPEPVGAGGRRLTDEHCRTMILRALDESYSDLCGQMHWYERVGLLYLLSILNAERPYAGTDDRAIPHLAWGQALYQVAATGATGFAFGSEAQRYLPGMDPHEAHASLGVMVLEGMARLGLSKGDAFKGRLQALWDLKLGGQTCSRPILRMLRMFPEFVPPHVAARVLCFKQPGMELTMTSLLDAADGSSWRYATMLWIDTHAATQQQEALSKFVRAAEKGKRSGDASARLQYGRARLAALQEGEKPKGRILLADWLMRKGRRLTEQQICEIVRDLLRTARRYGVDKFNPGEFHFGTVSVRATAEPGKLVSGDFAILRRRFVDENMISPFVYINPEVFDIPSFGPNVHEAYVCYSLGLMLLRLLQRTPEQVLTPPWGLRKLSGWADVKSVLRWAHFPSTRLACLISGVIQYQRVVSPPVTHPMEAKPVLTLVEFESILNDHLEDLKQNSYEGEDIREVILVDVDRLRNDPSPVLADSAHVVIGQVSSIPEGENRDRRYRRPKSQHGKVWRSLSKPLAVAEGVRLESPISGPRERKAIVPLFVTFPELTVPHVFMTRRLGPWANQLQAILIGGYEYGPSRAGDESRIPLSNEGFVVIPDYPWLEGREARSIVIPIEKLSPAPMERQYANEPDGYDVSSGQRLLLFRSQWAGNFAVLICYDFMNLPAQVLLQGRIQTLFVIAHNRDITGFNATAESTSRLLACNIVICNAAQEGGSLVHTNERDRFIREKIRLSGKGVEACIAVTIPVAPLARFQNARLQVHGDAQFHELSADFGAAAIKSGSRPWHKPGGVSDTADQNR
jgi:hypothetical protein